MPRSGPYAGQAYERLGDKDQAAASYTKAVLASSHATTPPAAASPASAA